MNNVLESLLARFSTDQTIELTKEEELAVLDAISGDDFIDHGSSRAAYMFADKYVVKIGMSTGGFNQNAVEQDFYHRHGNSGCFAHLFAYGRTLNIMEYLEDCCYYDEDDLWIDPDSEWTEDDYNAEIRELIEMANDLTDYYGGDNGQVGYSRTDDRYKLYDYGYSMDYNRDDIVDDIGYWMCAIDPITNAIEIVCGREMYTKSELYEMARGERLC